MVKMGNWVKWHPVILLLLSFALYANTLVNDFAQDDAIVIVENSLTKKGVQGIPEIFSKDSFFGYFNDSSKAGLVAGGRYRPLSIVSFALEYQVFGNKPFWFHLFNVVYFCFLVWLLYKTIIMMCCNSINMPETFSFLTVLLFVFHPIHTEVVANIKGRDEIFALLFSTASLYYSFKYMEQKRSIHLLAVFGFLFIGLLSKENTITFLAIIPSALLLFRPTSWSTFSKLGMTLLAAAGTYLCIRFAVLGDAASNTTSMEMLNNPFMQRQGDQFVAVSLGAKIATCWYVLLQYLKLLLLPHPLTNDYYPAFFTIKGFTNTLVWLSIVLHSILAYAAVKYRLKYPIISFGLLFYIFSILIFSNFFIPIGTFMSERFLFMPSVGFCLIVGFGFYKLLEKKSLNYSYAILIPLLMLMGLKTVSRNSIWKDNYTLFTSDVYVSSKSAKARNAAGGAMIEKAIKESGQEKTNLLNAAIVHLKEAIKIHPHYQAAYILLGNAYFHLGNFDEASNTYESLIRMNSENQEAIKNLAITYREKGKRAGETNGDLATAFNMFSKSLELSPKDPETLRLMAVCQGMQGNHLGAITYFKKSLEIDGGNANTWLNLAKAYEFSGNIEASNEAKLKAKTLNPNISK